MVAHREWMARVFRISRQYGQERWLGELAEELRIEEAYRAQTGTPGLYPQRKRQRQRPLGIPDDSGPSGTDGGGAGADADLRGRSGSRNNMPIGPAAVRS